MTDLFSEGRNVILKQVTPEHHDHIEKTYPICFGVRLFGQVDYPKLLIYVGCYV